MAHPVAGAQLPAGVDGPDRPGRTITRSTFGLDLVPDIDAYRLCERTLEYAPPFFVPTFTAFWLLEVISGRPLYPIQYLLIRAALSLFMVLELALSEHLGFGVSYAIASAAVVGLIVYYASAVLGSRLRPCLVGPGLAVLYAFHFVVLRNEDYALLLGSLLFFGTLAAVMSLTRRVDWYATGRPSAGGGTRQSRASLARREARGACRGARRSGRRSLSRRPWPRTPLPTASPAARAALDSRMAFASDWSNRWIAGSSSWIRYSNWSRNSSSDMCAVAAKRASSCSSSKSSRRRRIM